jgi:hypothetical protein
MANTAWGVISWVGVEMDVAEWRSLLRNFRHSVTSIHDEPDEYGCHYGYTLWKANRQDKAEAVGMAWDWREMRPGLVGQDDPMSILTNVRLTRAGQPLTEAEKVLALNDAVHELGWQRVARRELHRRQAQAQQPSRSGATRQAPELRLQLTGTVLRSSSLQLRAPKEHRSAAPAM